MAFSVKLSQSFESSYAFVRYNNIGGIRMLRNEEKQWELQVDHSLFAIKKLDITVSTCRVLDYYRDIMYPWWRGSKYWN